jgi:hypothetical protein
MTALQLSELQAFYNLEPFGEQRAELRHGAAMAMTANLNRNSKQKVEPFKAVEFMHYVQKEPERVYTPEELEAALDQILGL